MLSILVTRCRHDWTVILLYISAIAIALRTDRPYLLSQWSRTSSNVERQTSNVERRTSNVKRRTSNVERRTSNVERQTSNVIWILSRTNAYEIRNHPNAKTNHLQSFRIEAIFMSCKLYDIKHNSVIAKFYMWLSSEHDDVFQTQPLACCTAQRNYKL